jgi:hypothetical protein
MGAKQPKLAETGMARSGMAAKASCQEVARHLRRVKFDVASYINDKRATVDFSKRVAGAMARRAARIAYERQEESDVGHSCFNHDQWR